MQRSQHRQQHREHLTYQASGRGVLQVIVFSEQRHNLGEDGFAHQLSFLVFGDDARPHLDLLAHLQAHQETKGFQTGKFC